MGQTNGELAQEGVGGTGTEKQNVVGERAEVGRPMEFTEGV